MCVCIEMYGIVHGFPVRDLGEGSVRASSLQNDCITLNNLLHCIKLTLKGWQNGSFVRLESLERTVIRFQKPSNALWLSSHFVKKIYPA